MAVTAGALKGASDAQNPAYRLASHFYPTLPVLPAHARDVPIDEAIARELLWVQAELA